MCAWVGVELVSIDYRIHPSRVKGEASSPNPMVRVRATFPKCVREGSSPMKGGTSGVQGQFSGEGVCSSLWASEV